METEKASLWKISPSNGFIPSTILMPFSFRWVEMDIMKSGIVFLKTSTLL